MPRPYIGPLTEQICDTDGDTKPPAIIREWGQATQNPGEEIFMWAGATRNKMSGYCWMSVVVGTTDEGGEAGPGGDLRVSTVVETPPEHVERLLTPLAHASRVRIMQSLYDGPLSAAELGEAIGSKGGGLYHHLRDLKYASYLADDGGKYSLTNLGRQMLVTTTLIASQAIVDRGEEGLGVGTVESPEDDGGGS